MKKSILAVTMAAFMAVSGASAYPAEEESSFNVEVKIVTPYYSITTPADWAGAFTIKTVDNTTGKWVELFCNPENGGYAGHLFSILLDSTDHYEIIADHDLVGELEDAEGTVYHVVAVYPTDVQYDKENRDSYMAMSDQAGAILDTIEAAEGCTYTAAQSTAG